MPLLSYLMSGLLLVATYFPSVAAAEMTELKPVHLRCEYLTEPLGVDVATPRLSWALSASDQAKRGQQQTAYRIMVATSREPLLAGQADLWDSGRIESAQSQHLFYAGKPLTSLQPCYWRVQIWDTNGQPSAWSAPAHYTMGYLEPTRWTAAWIGLDDVTSLPLTLPMRVTPDGTSFSTAQWLGVSANSNASEAAGSTWFATHLDIPKHAAIIRGIAWFAGDDRFVAHINDKQAFEAKGTTTAATKDLTGFIHPGRNHVLIEVINNKVGPSGCIGTIEVLLDNGETIRLPTSANWLTKHGEKPGKKPEDADAWTTKAHVLGPIATAPWPAVTQPALTNVRPPVLLRRAFHVDKKPVRAMLVATALGQVDMHVNGHRISDEHFAPGWSDYSRSVCYRMYDVSTYLNDGENILGAVLADGWFRGNVSVLGQDQYGKQTRLRCQLHLFDDEGREKIITSDNDWVGTTGAIIASDMFDGETVDARRTAHGWDRVGTNNLSWKKVVSGSTVNPVPRWYRAPPIRAIETRAPLTIKHLDADRYIIDFGQNIAGWARLNVNEPSGRAITLRFAEMLNPDGSLYAQSLRSAHAMDTYICDGSGQQTWEPRFTFHGFRYVEIRGLSQAPTTTTVTAVVAHSDLQLTSSFTCSSALINRIHDNSWWGQRGNYFDIPTDCPQRDERMGWTGDTQVYVRTAAYHMDVDAFLSRWMDEMSDAQTNEGRYPIMAPAPHKGWSPGWSDAGLIVPATLYHVYGDTAILRKHYAGLKAHVAYYKKRSPDLIGPDEGFGDWLAIGIQTPKPLISTAYFAYSCQLLSSMANALGKSDEAKTFGDLAEQVAAAFQARFVKPDGTIGNHSQTGYLLALRFKLLNDVQRQQASDHLIAALAQEKWHLATGFLGINLLLPTLSDIGRTDVAYRLLQNTTYPSWGYSIAQGATTMWERWNSYTHDHGFGDVSMNSFNHYAYGACNEWLYRNVLGIDAAQPGFQDIVLKPQPGGDLTWVKGHFQSPHGLISSAWDLRNGKFTWDVVVPANTTATAWLPYGDVTTVQESGQALRKTTGLTVISAKDAPLQVRIGSGRYHFSCPLAK